VAGLATRTIATWDTENDTFEVMPSVDDRDALAGWAGISVSDLESEMDRREGIISGWLKEGATSIPEVNNAIEAFYAENSVA
jgi:hypothetical protein